MRGTCPSLSICGLVQSAPGLAQGLHSAQRHFYVRFLILCRLQDGNYHLRFAQIILLLSALHVLVPLVGFGVRGGVFFFGRWNFSCRLGRSCIFCLYSCRWFTDMSVGVVCWRRPVAGFEPIFHQVRGRSCCPNGHGHTLDHTLGWWSGSLTAGTACARLSGTEPGECLV